jgi:hypothetical protein
MGSTKLDETCAPSKIKKHCFVRFMFSTNETSIVKERQTVIAKGIYSSMLRATLP